MEVKNLISPLCFQLAQQHLIMLRLWAVYGYYILRNGH